MGHSVANKSLTTKESLLLQVTTSNSDTVSIWLLPTLICFSSNKPAVYCGDKTRFQPRSYTQWFKNRNQRTASIWMQLRAGNWTKSHSVISPKPVDNTRKIIRETATTILHTAQLPPSLYCTGSRERD